MVLKKISGLQHYKCNTNKCTEKIPTLNKSTENNQLSDSSHELIFYFSYKLFEESK